jgi:hypothetical protein
MPLQTIDRGTPGNPSDTFKVGEAFDTCQANDQFLDATKVTGPASAAEDQVALYSGITGKLIKAGDTISNYLSVFLVTLYSIFPRKIDTWAAIGSTSVVGAGQIFTLAQHTSSGLGGGALIAKAGGPVTDDGGTRKNSATGGFYLERVGYANLTPEMFGCIGDGIVNDYSAFQLALNAVSGKVLACTSGATYKSLTGFTVPANTYISAWGSKFDFSSSHLTGFTCGSGVWIVGASEIKGAGNSAYNISGRAVYCSGTNNSPAAPTFVVGPVILNNTFRAWGGYGINVQYCNNTRVENNKFYNIGYAACGGASQNDATFLNNYVEDVTPGSPGGDAYGCFLDRLNGTSETSDPRSYRCKMNGNTVKGVISTAANNGHALDSHGGVEIEFIGNTIDSCEGGIFVTASSIAGVEALGPKRCVVANNTINLTTYNNYAIIVRGAINGAVVAEYADSNVVSGNTIVGGGVAGSNTTGAVLLQASKNTKLDVGAISRSSPFGICIYNDNLNFNISGGTIIDCFDASVAIAAGIAVRGNNNKGFIGGISFKYETAGLGAFVMVNSIIVSGGLTGIDIDTGRCYFEGIDATHLAFNDGVGINGESLYGYSKTETFTLTSGNSSTVKSVVFAKRFPSAPKISLTNAGVISPGGKTMALRSANITTTGFDIIAYPYDLTTWSATASTDINWRATT